MFEDTCCRLSSKQQFQKLQSRSPGRNRLVPTAECLLPTVSQHDYPQRLLGANSRMGHTLWPSCTAIYKLVLSKCIACLLRPCKPPDEADPELGGKLRTPLPSGIRRKRLGSRGAASAAFLTILSPGMRSPQSSYPDSLGCQWISRGSSGLEI